MSALPHAQPILSPSESLYPAYGADARDEFGGAIALNAQWLAVGAPWDYNVGRDRSGAVYLFRNENGSWVLKDRIAAPAPSADAGFGFSIALDGSTLTIGEPYRAGGGAVHAFELTDAWRHAETLEPPTPNRLFGYDVAADGGTLVVGSPAVASAVAGEVHLYTQVSEAWSYQGVLPPRDEPAGGGYGQKVDISGDRIALTSAYGTEVDLVERVDGSWVPIRSFPGSDIGQGFDLLEDRLLIGARNVYEWNETDWTLSILPAPPIADAILYQAKLSADKVFIATVVPGPDSHRLLEYVRSESGWAFREPIGIDPIGDIELSEWTSIEIHDDTIVAGWRNAYFPWGRTSAVSVFRPGELARARQPVLVPGERPTDHQYGQAMALDGSRLAIASEEATSLFIRREGRLELEASLPSGTALSLDGARLLVADSTSARAGVYSPGPRDIYGVRRWELEQEFTGSGTFGATVALDTPYLLIGEPGTASDTGRVAVYVFEGSEWIAQGYLASPDSVAGDCFGASIALDGPRVLIGAPGQEHAAAVHGDAYLFELATNAWSLHATLHPPDGASPGTFGRAVALSGGRALVGAPGPVEGQAYVFEGTDWQLSHTLTAPSAETSFGSAVALDGNRAVLGAPQGSDGPESEGTAYVYGFDGEAWSITQRIVTEDPVTGKGFGETVFIQGRSVAAAAPQNSRIGPTAGAVYLYEVPFAVGIDDAPLAVASSTLSPPRPNPSTRATQFMLTLQAPDNVTVIVYDALGRTVSAPVVTAYAAGTHTLRLEDPDLPAGLYIVRVSGATVSTSRAFTRIR
ncbi:MAG: T9SS type A sorting domain-containing protein [Bacteroidota bacterium]